VGRRTWIRGGGRSRPATRAAARLGADRYLQLVSIEAATLPGAYGRTVAPGGVGVGEAFAFFPALGYVPLAIGEGGHVGCVNGHVFSQVLMLDAERRRARLQAGVQGWSVLAQLAGEAVHRAHAGSVSEGRLQARMLRNQSRNPRPGGKREETFDEASADESAGAKALATRPAERVKFLDQPGDFGGVEEFRYVADSRATRYLASCHRSSSLRWSRPRQLALRGASLSDLQD
jgi:hypothetical protein